MIDKLNEDVVEALRNPELSQRFLQAGVETQASTPAEAAELIRGEVRRAEQVAQGL